MKHTQTHVWGPICKYAPDLLIAACSGVSPLLFGRDTISLCGATEATDQVMEAADRARKLSLDLCQCHIALPLSSPLSGLSVRVGACPSVRETPEWRPRCRRSVAFEVGGDVQTAPLQTLADNMDHLIEQVHFSVVSEQQSQQCVMTPGGSCQHG